MNYYFQSIDTFTSHIKMSHSLFSVLKFEGLLIKLDASPTFAMCNNFGNGRPTIGPLWGNKWS